MLASRSVQVLALLRQNRAFSIFVLTQGASNLGDAVRNVVVPLVVLQLTHSPALLGAIALLETIPYLVLQLPFGALLDRWDRRRTLLLADVGRGLVTLSIPAAALAHGPVLAILFVTALPLATLSCLFGAGFGAITPSLVGRERMDRAYAIVEGVESAAWIAGPVVAGALAVAVGGINALAVDGASFLLSALGLALVPVPRTDRSAPPASLWQDVLAGLRFVVTTPALRRAQLAWTLYGAIGYGLVVGLVYVGSRGGSASPLLASLAVAAYAGGSLLGTMLAGWRRLPSSWRAVSVSMVVLALGSLLIAVGLAPAVVLGAFLFGVSEGYFLVVYLTLRARATPDELMGRANGIARLVSYVAGAIAVGWMGLALQWRQGPGAFGLLAALALVLAGGLAVTDRARPAAA
jgi:DHA3 family macrolide efflux protein-like MFS transporter